MLLVFISMLLAEVHFASRVASLIDDTLGRNAVGCNSIHRQYRAVSDGTSIEGTSMVVYDMT